eukprot:917430_1
MIFSSIDICYTTIICTRHNLFPIALLRLSVIVRLGDYYLDLYVLNMDDNRKRTRAPNESKSSNDSNPPKKRIKLRLVRNRNQCNVTDQIQKLQRDVSTALNRIAPLCLNQNIINSKQIQSIIGALNIRN